MRVLVADDERVNRQILQVALSGCGHEVLLACDGQEAWNALCDNPDVRVLLLDWRMPNLHGLALCKRIRETPQFTNTYILIVTAMDSREDILAGLAAGANDYVTKPFDAAILRARVEVGVRVVSLYTALEDRVRELEEAQAHVKTLQGILPICMHCHSIRSDDQSWQKLDSYIRDHTEVELSHGLCPECLEKYYPKTDTGSEEGGLGALTDM